ncbi:MAG: ArnT family glycosyltransferase [Patescibacteria group bacterium]
MRQKIFAAAALTVILLLAAYLRLYKIGDYMTFLGDEGRDVLVVKRMIVDHKFTLLGPTASVGGFFLGPIYYYFMLPFLWAFQLDPVGPAVMVALFGIATVYLVYRVGRDFFDSTVGLVAATLYALSPLVIAYSRSSWNPNLVPFFSLLFIFLLWRAIEKKTPRELFFAGVALGVGLQLHYLFLFLLPVAILWFGLYGRTKQLIKNYWLGIAGFVVGYSPFLAFEVRHGFPNTQSIMRFIFSSKETGFVLGRFWPITADVVFRLFGRLMLRLPQPEIWHRYTVWQKVVWEWGTILTILLGVGLLLTKRKSKAATMLLIWLAVPLLLFGFYQKPIYDYYFGIMFGLPFLVFGLTLSHFASHPIGKYVVLAIFLSVAWLNWQGRPYRFPPNRQLAQAKFIAREAFAKTEGRPFNFALVADFNSDHAYRYFFEIWGNPPVTIENEINDPQRRTVTDQLIVICEKPDCQPLGHPLWEIAGFGRAQIMGEWQVSFVKIFKLTHYTQ